MFFPTECSKAIEGAEIAAFAGGQSFSGVDCVL